MNIVSDTSYLNIGILFRSIFLYAVFVAFTYDLLPWYMLILANVVFYPAIYLHIHDLGHGASSKSIWFTSYNPLVADPLWGGLRAFRDTHYRHHRYFGTYNDPWLRYYDGHPATALFWNYFESEYSGYRYYKNKGLNKHLILSIILNAGMLVGNFVFFGPIYWIQILSQRTVRALAIFLFNYYTHRSGFSKDADYGVYERKYDLRYLLPILQFMWGRILINGLIYHNRHHSIKNWNVPVKQYQYLKDEKVYTTHQQDWPIKEIRHLS